MSDVTQSQPSTAPDDDDARLASLGYQPQLRRVLGLFANFSVAFTYLSPMVGIYSLFVLGVGTGGPAYVWLTWIPVVGMLLVALVFGELASHYPVAGRAVPVQQVLRRARLRLVRRLVLRDRAAGHGRGRRHRCGRLLRRADAQLVRLEPRPDRPQDDPADHRRAAGRSRRCLNITGAKVMGQVAQFGVYVEIVGTVGIALILGDPRIPPRTRLPVLHRRTCSTRRATRSGWTSAATGSRRGADRRPRAGLHLLRVRVRR